MSTPSEPTEAPSVGGTFRRLFVLAVALAMMAGLSALRADDAGGAADPLTLAAIGFVLLAAFTVGELGTLLGLPKVTGYIVAGVLLGPQVADILSLEVVGDLRTFNTLALGLIATTAGLELHLPSIRRVMRTLAATVGLKLLLLPIFVGVPLVLAERLVPSFGLEGWGPILALALVISVLGIGTSPAIALAVVNDSGSKGRLTDLLLGIAVVKDLVVVTCLAVAIAVSRSLLGGGAMDASVFTHLGMELGGSVLVGLAVGGLLILYFRFVRVEPLFSVLVTILLVAEVSHTLHLELLLVFITAGFLVRNFSKYEHELLHPLEKISLPVFVVFFTTAGAGVDLRATLPLLPLALALMVLRAIAYMVAGRLGGRLGGESPAVAKNAWLTYLPQAGVTLGLVLLAAKALPELATPLNALGLALVTLNLLVGPVTLAMGLGRAGETAAARAAATEATAPEGAPEGALDADAPAGDQDAPAAAAPGPTPVPLVAPLQASLDAARAQMDGVVAALIADTIDPVAAALEEVAAALPDPESTEEARIREIRRTHRDAPAWHDGRLERAAAQAFDGVSASLREAPWTLAVPMDPALFAAPAGAGTLARARAGWARTLHPLLLKLGRTPERRVPVQLSLRYAVEPRLGDALAVTSANLYRTEARILGLARAALSPTGARPPEEAQGLARAWRAGAEADLRRAIDQATADAARLLAEVGGPLRPTESLRYADVDTRVDAALRQLSRDGEQWRALCRILSDAVRTEAFVETSRRVLGSALERRVGGALVLAAEEVVPELREAADRLEAIASDASGVELDDEALQRISTGCTDGVLRRALPGVRRAAHRFRRRAQAGGLVREVADVVRNTPETCRVVGGAEAVAQAPRPAAVPIREVPLARIMDVRLRGELLPAVTGALASVSELVAASEARLREGTSVAAYGVNLAARGALEGEDERREVLLETIRRGARRIRGHADELLAGVDAARAELEAAEAESVQRLRTVLSVTPASGALVGHTVRTTLSDVADAVGGMAAAAGRRARALAARARGLGQAKDVRALRIRSGHERLDAAAMRAYVDEHVAPAATRGVPAAYIRAFEAPPLGESAAFVGRKDLLERLVEELAGEREHAPSATLLVAPKGGGCSSLLQLVQVRVAGPRVVWLDQVFASRPDGLLGALAAELGTAATVSMLQAALVERPTVVLIDALETWVEPDARGVDHLEGLLELIASTGESVRWLLAMNDVAFSFYDETLDLRHRLPRVEALAPLGWEDVRALVERRGQRAGFGVRLAQRGLLGRLGLGDARRNYYKALARAARGMPAAALLLHLEAIQGDGDDHVLAGVPAVPGLPFVPTLPTPAVALLGALFRHGPLDAPRLAHLVNEREDHIHGYIRLLRQVGLVSPRGPAGQAFGLVARFVPALRRELEEMGLLLRGAP